MLKHVYFAITCKVTEFTCVLKNLPQYSHVSNIYSYVSLLTNVLTCGLHIIKIPHDNICVQHRWCERGNNMCVEYMW